MRSGSGVSVTSIHSTDPRVQDEPEEEEKETEKKLPGQGTRVNTDQFPKGNSSCSLITYLWSQMTGIDKIKPLAACIDAFFYLDSL